MIQKIFTSNLSYHHRYTVSFTFAESESFHACTVTKEFGKLDGNAYVNNVGNGIQWKEGHGVIEGGILALLEDGEDCLELMMIIAQDLYPNAFTFYNGSPDDDYEDIDFEEVSDDEPEN